MVVKEIQDVGLLVNQYRHHSQSQFLSIWGVKARTIRDQVIRMLSMERDTRRMTVTPPLTASVVVIAIIVIIPLVPEASIRLILTSPLLILIVTVTTVITNILTDIKLQNRILLHLIQKIRLTLNPLLICPIDSTHKDESYRKMEMTRLQLRLSIFCRTCSPMDDQRIVARPECDICSTDFRFQLSILSNFLFPIVSVSFLNCQYN